MTHVKLFEGSGWYQLEVISKPGQVAEQIQFSFP